jgi:DegV family uncharacterized protein
MELNARPPRSSSIRPADYPQGPDRFPNWRVVPLNVRFGDESFRDYAELGREFHERLRRAPVLPTTSQPTPGDFLAAYEELGAYERILSLHLPLWMSGTVESARRAAEELGGGKVRAIDTGTVSAGLAMLALAVQRRLERGTTDVEVDGLIERYRREQQMVWGPSCGSASATRRRPTGSKRYASSSGERGRRRRSRSRRARRRRRHPRRPGNGRLLLVRRFRLRSLLYSDRGDAPDGLCRHGPPRGLAAPAR